MRQIRIRPLDPLMVRDGRPFKDSPGARAYSMMDVVPGVIAGTVRTMLAEQAAKSSRVVDYHTFSKVPVYGPLYVWKGKPFFPLPSDIGFYEDENGALQMNYRQPQPLVNGQGYLGIGDKGDHESLWPAKVIPQMGKVSSIVPAYLSLDWMSRWLRGDLSPKSWTSPLAEWQQLVRNNKLDSTDKDVHFLPPFALDERDHIAVESGTRMPEDQALFTTQSIVFPPDLDMHARVEIPQEAPWPMQLSTLHSLGGKRRLAHFSESQDDQFWQCPEALEQSLDGSQYVRLVLATPAYFAKGWKPRWLDDELCTNEIFAKEISREVKLQLVWACISRWQPVSGWSYSLKQPKAVRRMVPAGSVYFFKVTEGNPRELARRGWLNTVSDANRRKGAFDKEDGFGLALWGTWRPDENDIDSEKECEV